MKLKQWLYFSYQGGIHWLLGFSGHRLFCFYVSTRYKGTCMLYEKEKSAQVESVRNGDSWDIVSRIHWMDGRERQFRGLAGRRIQCSEPIKGKEMFHQVQYCIITLNDVSVKTDG
jgi:hypothetical protein